MSNAVVSVMMGSDNDYSTMERAVRVLKEFDIPFDVIVTSAHRTPARTVEYIETSEANGTKVFIVGAGAAAHLAGVVAAHTTLPVIGVPIDATSLKGVDALYSTVMMPGGIPVASMAVGTAGAMNAGLFAVSILSTSDKAIHDKLQQYRKDMVAKVQAKSDKLRSEVFG